MALFDGVTREYRYLSTALRTLGRVKDVKKDSPRTAVDDLEETALAHPDNVAFIFEGREVTYREYDATANRVASWAKQRGLKRGDNVVLFMLNRPEYVSIWYGLAKIGVVTALVNNQLVGQALGHCVTIADARHIIVDHELADAFTEAREHIPSDMTAWAFGGNIPDSYDFNAALLDASPIPPPAAERAGMVANDPALKIYTSGTTGLPKAANITHVRVRNFINGFAAAFKSTARDRMLMVLPLYHATGGLCGLGVALTAGGAVILEKRFSASRFWDAAVDHDATLFTYVGEICRFLLAADPHPKERAHKLRGAVGNGLRPEVWERFEARFNVFNIMEFYGSTEGNVSLINFDGRLGAVGRVPNYLKHRFNVDIVRFDHESEEPERDAEGRCIPVDVGEVGEMIGEIRTDDGRYQFDGYAKNAEQTQKKILTDVFQPGDQWFRTGDLMRRDAQGYYYFVDRVGDTFRWKSENVATSEVSEALSVFEGITQANVYGVPVPGYDGRAGMAAIEVEGDFDFAGLYDHVRHALPDYARPVFLRVGGDSSAHTTGTFKFQKRQLVQEGFDLGAVSGGVIYIADTSAGAYVPLDQALYERIQSGDARL